MAKIAVIGEGVIGCSTALQLLKKIPNSKITVFYDRPFEKTCSYGPAGLFRIDFERYKEYGRKTFEWFAELYRTKNGRETGVKLLSGHIQSDDKGRLEQQEKAYSDIVFNFHWLTDRELDTLHPNHAKYCIHYTAFASEGNIYVPFLKRILTEQGVKFVERKVENLEKLADEGFDSVVNCAGIDGGNVAGDDDSVYPIRGVVFEVDEPWHKHFNYRDFITFTIPKNNSVVVGSVKQENRSDLEITDEDRNDILDRYKKLQPAMTNPKIISEWSGLRPARSEIRIEPQIRTSPSGKKILVVHHYGHGGNGFTLGYGTAEKAAELVVDNLKL